jgi:hypothetical protein
VGSQIDFEAVADSFTANPTRLVLTTTPDKIDNWPAPARR